MPPKWWDPIMSRVIAVDGMWLYPRRMLDVDAEPGLLRSAPPTEELRIESEPPGADAKTSQGQTCRTPCELTVQPAANSP